MDKELEEKNRKFFRKLSGKYDNKVSQKINISRIRKILKLAKTRNNTKILDIGCGTGSLLYILSKNESLKLYGIDISKEMLQVARKKLGKNANLKEGSVKELGKIYRKNYFDYIFIDDAFHHFPEQIKVMKDVKDLLKKKGKLVISDFSFGKFGNWIFHRLEPGNSGMHTLVEFERLFENCGFQKIRLKKFGWVSIYVDGQKGF